MPKKKITASQILNEYVRQADPSASAQAGSTWVKITVAGKHGPVIATCHFDNFKDFLDKRNTGFYVKEKEALARYMAAIVENMETGEKNIPTPASLGITARPSKVEEPEEAKASSSRSKSKGKEPEPEPSDAGESLGAKSTLSKGPVSFGADSTVVLIDPQGKEVDPADIPELTEYGTASLVQSGYHALVLTPSAAERKAKETRGREAQEELGRTAMIAQILQATRSGDLKSSEVFEISSDLASGDLSAEKLKKIGTQILQARRRALEEFVGKKRQAKALGPRALKKLLVKMYGK